MKLKSILSLLIFAAASTLSFAQSGAFTTDKQNLVDANGKVFVIKGMNNPHAWFGEKAYQALDDIRAVGSNTIRIVWDTRGKDTALERIIERCIELDLHCKADHTVILETCNKLGYGFMPWSWTGNNKENKWLDLVESSDWKTLTWWGQQVISGKGGITETAKKASEF